jgi:hypothetical protein
VRRAHHSFLDEILQSGIGAVARSEGERKARSAVDRYFR